MPADLYYVSPTQINFLVPPNMLAVPVSVYVTVDSLRGPIIQLTLGSAAPGLFQFDAVNAIATLPMERVLTPSSPAKPGDIVILWATGLGADDPMPIYGELPTAAASLVAGANLSILLDGKAVTPAQSAMRGSLQASPACIRSTSRCPCRPEQTRRFACRWTAP